MPRLSYTLAPVLLLCSAAAWAAVPAEPVPEDLPSMSSNCARPNYPLEARRREEQGISTFAVLIAANGAVRRMELLGSSGSATLDAAAQESMGSCRWKPAVVGGRAVERWEMMQFVWKLADDDPIAVLTALLDVAAAQGRAAAHYALYHMLSRDIPKTASPKRIRLTELLRRSAEGGHCIAKFTLAEHYERAPAAEQDLRKARDWYEQAAACGNPVATDRLRHMPPGP